MSFFNGCSDSSENGNYCVNEQLTKRGGKFKEYKITPTPYPSPNSPIPPNEMKSTETLLRIYQLEDLIKQKRYTYANRK